MIFSSRKIQKGGQWAVYGVESQYMDQRASILPPPAMCAAELLWKTMSHAVLSNTWQVLGPQLRNCKSTFESQIQGPEHLHSATCHVCYQAFVESYVTRSVK